MPQPCVASSALRAPRPAILDLPGQVFSAAAPLQPATPAQASDDAHSGLAFLFDDGS
jgi:hypothetical protein